MLVWQRRNRPRGSSVALAFTPRWFDVPASGSDFQIEGPNNVTNARYTAIACALLFAISGCGGSGKITQPAPDSENFNDFRYHQSVMGFTDAGFRAFLNGLPPAERVKYINKSVEESDPINLYALKGVYQQFASDSNAEVAAAAKEALAKVPTPEEYENLKKEVNAKIQADVAKQAK